MTKSKPYKLFEKFIQYHEPTFYIRKSGEWIFCYDLDCKECIVKKECEQTDFEFFIHLTEDEYNQAKLEYPEYFV